MTNPVPRGKLEQVNEYYYGNGMLLGMKQIDHPEKSYWMDKGPMDGVSVMSQDALGSVTMITGINGQVMERYGYDAFGKAYEGVFAGEIPGAGRPKSYKNGNMYGFTGQRVEAEVGVYGFAFRDYNPQTARWLTVDPIKDGLNWYQYCYNNPTNYIDPTGLYTVIDSNGDVISTTNIGSREVDKNIYQMPADGVGPPAPIDKLGEYEARGHYIAGSGESLDAYFSEVDIGLKPGNFQGFSDAIVTAANEMKIGNSGTIDIDTTTVFDVSGWAGQVTYRLKGTLTYDENGRSFEGYIGAYDETYDFDPQPWGSRDWWKEVGVRTANVLLPGEPFDIEIHGHREVTWECLRSNQ